jgi:DNA modification methylase
MKIGSIEDLNPAPYNPRRIDAESLQGLQVSVRELGDISGICFNERTKQMFAGHQRVSALKAEFGPDLKIVGDEVVGFSILTPKGDRFPIRIVDWPEDKERLANLTANNHLIQGVWTETAEDVLGQANNDFPDLCEQLRLNDLDLELLIEKGKKDHIGKGKDAEPDLDHADALLKKWQTGVGDLWKIGDHLLLCGDSTKEEDVKRVMAGERAGICWTDPPWNVDYGKDDHPAYKKRKIENDNLGEKFDPFAESFCARIYEALVPGGILYMAMSAQEWGLIMRLLEDEGFHWSSTIIWNKNCAVLSRKDYHTKYEPIWYGWRGDAPRIKDVEDRKQNDVWDIDRPSRSEEHPTMKPVELVSRSLANSSVNGAIVFEPFSGSGTTVVASENMGRRCRAIEIVPQYVAVCLERMATAFPGIKIEKA